MDLQGQQDLVGTGKRLFGCQMFKMAECLPLNWAEGNADMTK
jgi:hypothetical protein